MFRLLDLWATSYRKWRSISVAVVLWLIVAAGAIMKCQSNADPFQGRQSETAVVISLSDPVGFHDEPVEAGFVYGIVLLADSTSIRIQFVEPLPEIGAKVPLLVELYESGKRLYSLDITLWRTMGPR